MSANDKKRLMDIDTLSKIVNINGIDVFSYFPPIKPIKIDGLDRVCLNSLEALCYGVKLGSI